MKPTGCKTAVYKSATTTNNFRSRFAVRASVALAALLFAVFFPPSALAQLFGDDAARDLAGRNAAKLEDLARIVENMRGQLGEMTQKQQAIDRHLRDLAGQMEESAAAVAGGNREELKALEASLSRAAAERGKLAEDFAALRQQFAEVNKFVDLPPEQEFYESAFADYRSEKYAAAVEGFQQALKYYPEGKFNASARYWMSRSFLALDEYDSAAEAARQLIELQKDGDKAPEAMLTLAQAQRGLGQEEESRATLEALLAAHPTTLAADKAREMLSP